MKITNKSYAKYALAAVLALAGLALAGVTGANAAPWRGGTIAIDYQTRPVVVRYYEGGYRRRQCRRQRFDRDYWRHDEWRGRDRDDWRWRRRDNRRWRDRDDYRR